MFLYRFSILTIQKPSNPNSNPNPKTLTFSLHLPFLETKNLKINYYICIIYISMSSYLPSFLSGNNQNCVTLPTKPNKGETTSSEITISKECLDKNLQLVNQDERPDSNSYNYYRVIPDTTTPETTYKVTYTKYVNPYEIPKLIVYRTKAKKGFFRGVFSGGKRKSHIRKRKSRHSRKHHRKTRKHYRKK